MWKENLIALKEKSGLSYAQIADGVGVSESTIKRIFSKSHDDCKRGHSIALIIDIVHFLGGKVIEVFEDTNAIISNHTYEELTEKIEGLTKKIDLLTAELDLAHSNNTIFQNEIVALKNENTLLQTQNMYKDKIIALLEIIKETGN